MKSFSFLSFSIIPSCFNTYVLCNSTVFSDIISDLSDHANRVYRVDRKLDEFKFKSISFYVSEVITSDDCIYRDLVGFKVFVEDSEFYGFLFDCQSFPDGSGLPEAVGKALENFLKETLYG